MQNKEQINTVGRSPFFPGDANSVSLPVNAVNNTIKPSPVNTNGVLQQQKFATTIGGSPKKGSLKRRAGKENKSDTQYQFKKPRVQLRTAHVGDHSVTATEVTAQILAEGVDATLIGQGADILKQYVDTFFGPVPGFNFNPATGAYDANSLVASLE